MRIKQSGFTLIELLVTISIAAILAAMAVPGFQTMLAKRRVNAAADALVSDLQYARSEAVKRTNNVTVCSSVDGTTCKTTPASWKDGWIVFVDAEPNGTIDSGDQVLRVQDALAGIDSITDTGGALLKITYRPLGQARGATQSFFVRPTGTGDYRLICVSNQGRAALRLAGTTSCS